MNIRPLLALALLGLCACSPIPVTPSETEFEMKIKSVALPTSIAPDAAMDVVVEVTIGGCIKYKRIEVAARTASRLELKAIGTRPAQETPCTADIGWRKVTYTDPGMPARTSPFEVVVNGKSWRTVQVK